MVQCASCHPVSMNCTLPFVLIKIIHCFAEIRQYKISKKFIEVFSS